MPKLTDRLSEEEIKRANAEHDKRHGSPTDLLNRRRLGKPGRDYSGAHQKLLAEWKRLANPNCAKCGGKGYTVKTSNVFNREIMRNEAPSPVALKKKFYEDQLKALAEEEQKLIEAKALKLSYCWNGSGVLIKKEQNQMALLLEDAQELAEKLTDFLTKPRS